MFLGHFLWLALLSVSPPSDGVFDDREADVIDRCPAFPLMRLYTSDNEADTVILRTVCSPVDRSVIGTPRYERLREGMLATVNDPENRGVGIAAPQVGVTKRIIAVQRFDKDDEPFEFYLNPKIVVASEAVVESDEGCLSVPDGRGCVLRHAAITIEYNDPADFSPRREDIEGFTAIIFQHEIDHLDGVLFTDKILEPATQPAPDRDGEI